MDLSRTLWCVSATSQVEMKGEKKVYSGGVGEKSPYENEQKRGHATEMHKSADQETFESQIFCMNA